MILWDINRLATRDIKARLKLPTDCLCCRTEVHLRLQLSLQAMEGHRKNGCRQRDSKQAGSHSPGVHEMGSGGCPTLSGSIWKSKGGKETAWWAFLGMLRKWDKQELVCQPGLPARAWNPVPEDSWNASKFSLKDWASKDFACFFGLFWGFGVFANECLWHSRLTLRAIDN